MKEQTAVRELVLDTLLEEERAPGHSHLLIAGLLEKNRDLPQRDKAFAKRLFEGTVERRITLDYFLNTVSKTPVRKMKPLIRCLLRMGTYQLLYMDQVADYAAISESVNLAGKRGFAALKGFVNGVLRSIARGRDAGSLTLPERDADPVRHTSVKTSVPEELVRVFVCEYGPERAEEILEGFLSVRPVSLRFRTDLSEAEKERILEEMRKGGAQLRQSPLAAQVYLLTGAGDLTDLPGYREGAFLVQDASSVCAVLAAGIRPGDRVLDCCAAPGGKSLLAFELAGPDGSVTARDVSAEKAARIRENAKRMGAENLQVEVWDAGIFRQEDAGTYDVVLLDVPCSGLGILGKKRDIKYRLGEEDFASLEALQERIVSVCAQYVRPGGTLLYSTCTLRRAENEDRAEWIAREAGFSLEEMRRFTPDTDPCDGFFYAVLRKKEKYD
ncbi:MAG: 16S rRNA (cytosine(967)-C(5))-methyltransferase RsmB [Lachnospiraceae bacterium]|nr:16S rRNA (cytosine(967)-C(5))-methyltransferase RsmB [Lachnospiraceae bacterium]